MKKNITSLLAFCSLYCGVTAALTSCIDYDDATTEIAARVQLVLPSEFTGSAGMEGHEIVMQQGTTRLTATTDAQGVATFARLVPDVYDISCSWEITDDQYRQQTGQELSGGTSCTIAGSLKRELSGYSSASQPCENRSSIARSERKVNGFVFWLYIHIVEL